MSSEEKHLEDPQLLACPRRPTCHSEALETSAGRVGSRLKNRQQRFDSDSSVAEFDGRFRRRFRGTRHSARASSGSRRRRFSHGSQSDESPLRSRLRSKRKREREIAKPRSGTRKRVGSSPTKSPSENCQKRAASNQCSHSLLSGKRYLVCACATVCLALLSAAALIAANDFGTADGRGLGSFGASLLRPPEIDTVAQESSGHHTDNITHTVARNSFSSKVDALVKSQKLDAENSENMFEKWDASEPLATRYMDYCMPLAQRRAFYTENTKELAAYSQRKQKEAKQRLEEFRRDKQQLAEAIGANEGGKRQKTKSQSSSKKKKRRLLQQTTVNEESDSDDPFGGGLLGAGLDQSEFLKLNLSRIVRQKWLKWAQMKQSMEQTATDGMDAASDSESQSQPIVITRMKDLDFAADSSEEADDSNLSERMYYAAIADSVAEDMRLEWGIAPRKPAPKLRPKDSISNERVFGKSGIGGNSNSNSSRLFPADGELLEEGVGHGQVEDDDTGTCNWYRPSPAESTLSKGPLKFAVGNYPVVARFYESLSRMAYYRVLNTERGGVVTIVTQIGIDRLHDFAMVQAWDGPISVAIYVPRELSWQFVARKVRKFAKAAEARNSKLALSVSLLFETEDSNADEGFALLYPVNHLRNLALQCADSDLVFLLDGDFVPSYRLHSLLTTHPTYRALVDAMVADSRRVRRFGVSLRSAEPRTALVLPAFETSLTNIQGLAAMFSTPHFGTETLRSLFVADKIKVFHQRCKFCHAYTNYTRFFTNRTHEMKALPPPKLPLKVRQRLDDLRAKQLGLATATVRRQQELAGMLPLRNATMHRITKPLSKERYAATEQFGFDIEYHVGYEPYVIVPRVGLHRYDARFRGYGYNKIAHLTYLGLADGFRFHVLKHAFVVSASHSPSASRDAFRKRSQQWVQSLWTLTLAEIRQRIDCCGRLTK